MDNRTSDELVILYDSAWERQFSLMTQLDNIRRKHLPHARMELGKARKRRQDLRSEQWKREISRLIELTARTETQLAECNKRLVELEKELV